MKKSFKICALGFVLIILPCLVLVFAKETRVGPVLAILPWADQTGLHLGDVMIAAIIAPFWWLIGAEFLRTLRRRSRRRPRIVW